MKKAFTMADRLSRLHNRLTGLRSAFTMAEILLSLTIIGVVAAITLPSLTGNINERTWNTQRKALYARMSQAISLMPAMNGWGTVTESESGSITEDTAAETFITNGLSKVLQLNNICSNDNISDCGIPAKITTLGASTISTPLTMQELNPKMAGSFDNGVQSFKILNTKAAAFETKNGESVIAYVNPQCIGDLQSIHWSTFEGHAAGDLYQRTVCANFIYDLNGTKGPNTVGKDIGVMTIMYPSDPVIVAPYPLNKTLEPVTLANAAKSCSNFDSDSRLPNLAELYSMFVNKSLLSELTNSIYWSSQMAVRPTDNRTAGLAVNMNTGEIDDFVNHTNSTLRIWCIKR